MTPVLSNPVIAGIAKRISVPVLTDPAPDRKTMDSLFQAALNVPDHMLLRPWRFLRIEGDARKALGQLFAEAEAKRNPQASQEVLDKKAAKAFRAPLVLVAICTPKPHAKVPEWEQLMSTGCVLHNLGLGLRSLGFASIWRTGSFAFDHHVQAGLGLGEQESIVGYLYVGTANCRAREAKVLPVEDYVSDWPNLE